MFNSQDAVSIGSLVPQMFDPKSVECQKCHSDQATVHRSLSQLPEVLVLCLKRFSSNPVGGYKKHRSHVTIDATLEFSMLIYRVGFWHAERYVITDLLLTAIFISFLYLNDSTILQCRRIYP